MRGEPGYDVVDEPEDRPIVLAGRPGKLRGEVNLRNPGEDRVILRGGLLRSEPLAAAAARGAQPGPGTHALAPVVLGPGQARRVRLSMAVGPQTPPGEYRGELVVGGRERAVVIHVTEIVSLRISPARLVVENRPGESFTKKVVFTNDGNVPLTIGEIGPVVLDEELFECRTLRAALAEVDEETGTMQEYLDRIVRKATTTVGKAAILRVRNTAGVVVLQPGEVRAVDVEIRVPEHLARRTRHFGSAAISTSDLGFVVVPSPGEPEPAAPPAPAAQPRPRRPRKAKP